MRRRRNVGVALLAWALALAGGGGAMAQRQHKVENVSTFEPQSPEDERKGFHLPEGFDIELVAAEPDIHKPLNIAFDAKGRLWVTDTLEYPYAAKEGAKPRDTVKVLADFRPDGRAGSITTFADGLNIPIGLLPLPQANAALVHSIPDVYRLTDTDGDGHADRREPFYKSIGFRDTHGMTNAFTWGFDGWVYACHGFANDSELKGSDRAAIVLQSGNTYRMRPDGSHVEFFTHGQVNPFGLAFDPRGNLYSSDCHSRPIYQLLRGAWYPSFGKPDDGLGFAPEMMTHDHGSTAIAGIVYYAADHFPAPFRDTIFIGNVVTNRVNHDRLEWHGSSPKAIEQPDFLTCDDNWFRPVDLELGPDGALYIADFYNRIIGHYEVPLTHPGRDRERGRIWRVVYRGKGGSGNPAGPRADWTAAAPEALIEDLGHPNLAVRMQAETQLGSSAPERFEASAIRPIAELQGNAHRRAHELWVLHRWNRLDEPTVGRAARDDDAEVRIHAMRVLGERGDWTDGLRGLAEAGLKDRDPFVRRAAAEALGRHPDQRNVRPLLDARQASSADDSHLIHVVRMALRDQLRPAEAWAALGGLALSERDERDIADVALGVPSPESASYLLAHLRRREEPAARVVSDVHHVARYAKPEDMSTLLTFIRERRSADATQLAHALKALQQGSQERGAAFPEQAKALAVDASRRLIASAKGEEVGLGIGLVSAFQLRDVLPALDGVINGPSAPEGQRIEALKAYAAVDPGASVPLLGRVLGDPASPPAVRENAAQTLAGLNRPDGQAALLSALPTAPGRVQTAIAAGLAQRKEGAEALLDAVGAGRASARLLQDSRVAGLLNNAKPDNLSQRLAVLLRGLPPADEKLNGLIQARRTAFAGAKADAGRGAKVFETACMACHQLGGKGARVGPQLDGIGARGPERLLEDILDPNRNVDQTFRVTTLALADGRVVTGLLLKEEGEVLVLADPQGKEVRVPKADVEERTISQLSLMPANLVEQIPERDFFDLLAYLLTRTAKEPGSPDEAGTTRAAGGGGAGR